MHDVIVLGAGIAGLSAALWCDELGLKTLVLEREPEIGGQLLRVFNPIEDHLGAHPAKNGIELRDRIAEQIARRNFQLRLNLRIDSVNLSAKTVFLSDGESLSARALVLATGVRRRKLNVAGEAEFRGRGILESGKRDAPLAEGKTVCVIGGGDAAAENALILAERAAKVYLVHRRNEFRARTEFLDKIKENPKIETLTETRVIKILGREAVEKIELENRDAGIFQIAVDAVVLRIGVEPNTELFRRQIELDNNNYIKIDSSCETNLENVFAVGDISNPLSPTISSGVGAGATAAKVIAAHFSS
ncbi:MAG: NAD(P)/FAD-dependent oxidoreductase [Acidobacteriota bacterium]|nr:NAD(P)/FAD-dependent oxidoreductase [Acidobacteriota bacterium]